MSIMPTAGDYNLSNNSLTYCFPVVNALDPNAKEVYPMGNVDSGQWLTYTIRFQNTGNAPAQNIYIIDTLSPYIDASTFQLLAYSALNLTQIFGNVVRFNFPNINLPDSASNEPASHGYVQFKVKLKAGAPSGVQVNNTAYIYFDLNPAVVTNTVSNSYCGNLNGNSYLSICAGDSVNFNGAFYSNNGIYSAVLQNSQGCDSTANLHLNIYQPITSFSHSICQGEYYVVGNHNYDQSGNLYRYLTELSGLRFDSPFTTFCFEQFPYHPSSQHLLQPNLLMKAITPTTKAASIPTPCKT